MRPSLVSSVTFGHGGSVPLKSLKHRSLPQSKRYDRHRPHKKSMVQRSKFVHPTPSYIP